MCLSRCKNNFGIYSLTLSLIIGTLVSIIRSSIFTSYFFTCNIFSIFESNIISRNFFTDYRYSNAFSPILDDSLLCFLVIFVFVVFAVRLFHQAQFARFAAERADVGADDESHLARTLQQQLQHSDARGGVRFRQLQQEVGGVFEAVFRARLRRENIDGETQLRFEESFGANLALLLRFLILDFLLLLTRSPRSDWRRSGVERRYK